MSGGGLWLDCIFNHLFQQDICWEGLCEEPKENLRGRLDRPFKLPNSPQPYYAREHSSNALQIPNVWLWNMSYVISYHYVVLCYI